MATIKELAAYTGLSPSTVSIVLGGKAQQRKIPESTQRRVQEAAQAGLQRGGPGTPSGTIGYTD